MNPSELNRFRSPGAAVWKQRYEALRERVVQGAHILEADPLSLVLLLRQGVAGWMRSWPDLAQTPRTPPAPPAPVPLLPTSVWQQQLTELLAEMSFAHLPSTTTL